MSRAAAAACANRTLARLSAAAAVAELGTIGLVRRTPVRRAELKIRTPVEALRFRQRSEERVHETYSSSGLELNLLEDPTAGLATGPAEELTPTELETQVRVLVSGYTPSLYRMLYMPFIDVVLLLVREGLVPNALTDDLLRSTTTTSLSPTTGGSSSGYAAGGSAAASLLEGAAASAPGAVGSTVLTTNMRPVRPEEVMARWFMDGPSTLKAPHATAEAMGKRRWTAFCRALEAHWADMEPVMPLTRVVHAHGLREELYVPLLRQLAMELVDPTKRASAVTILPGIILSLANGRAPRSMGLPENDVDRVGLVANLFLGVAQETGQTDLAYLAVQLLRANGVPTPFSAQKQMTNTFAASARIENDWQVRATSLLIEAYPKWLEYHKTVQRDGKRALAALQAQRGEDGDAAAVSAAAGGAGTAESDIDRMREKRSRSRAGGAQAADSGDATAARASTSSGAASDTVTAATGAAAGGAASHTPAATDPAATEQYRYFTSRRQDDVTRIAALERNIADALRSRATELQDVVERPRRGLRSNVPASQGSAASAKAKASAAAGDAAATDEVAVEKASPQRGRRGRGRSGGRSGGGEDAADGARRTPARRGRAAAAAASSRSTRSRKAAAGRKTRAASEPDGETYDL